MVIFCEQLLRMKAWLQVYLVHLDWDQDDGVPYILNQWYNLNFLKLSVPPANSLWISTKPQNLSTVSIIAYRFILMHSSNNVQDCIRCTSDQKIWANKVLKQQPKRWMKKSRWRKIFPKAHTEDTNPINNNLFEKNKTRIRIQQTESTSKSADEINNPGKNCISYGK